MIDTHLLSAKEAVHQVLRLTDRTKLQRTRDREEAHPSRAGGRKQVIAAIDAQLLKAPVPVEGPWRENNWAGLPHYECTRCPFDTLELHAIREHVKKHDPAPIEEPAAAAPELVGSAHAETVLALTTPTEPESAPVPAPDAQHALEMES